MKFGRASTSCLTVVQNFGAACGLRGGITSKEVVMWEGSWWLVWAGSQPNDAGEGLGSLAAGPVAGEEVAALEGAGMVG